jgi:hypothetical protein
MWKPIETQPDHGSYLVRLPTARRGIEVCHARDIANGIMRTVGGLFSFDAEKPDAWTELPTEAERAVVEAALAWRKSVAGERLLARVTLEAAVDALLALQKD